MMNKRIEELAEQSKIYITGFPILDEQKFAELIVRECGNYMNSRIPGNIEVSATVAKMKQHFGVDQSAS